MRNKRRREKRLEGEEALQGRLEKEEDVGICLILLIFKAL